MTAPPSVFARSAGAATILIGAILLPLSAAAQPAAADRSVIGAAEALKPGEYLWAPDVAPRGPLLLIVNLATQRGTRYPKDVRTADTFRRPAGSTAVWQ
ncbi:hypothetical protein MNQ96_14090 [Sphingopyxis granuli]|uniref:hypothetical protein n=1 Tax=Sphingopyxis granuli TaxID=267128 RepID=UPI001F53C9AD|nr:hypothetical protein [Sphingopyxis granuli]UNK78674.1 hypothetical protein MNQ96_14090 [Sphingopyxis granuli]